MALGSQYTDGTGRTWTYFTNTNIVDVGGVLQTNLTVTLGDGENVCVSPEVSGSIAIPSAINSVPVTEIAGHAFYWQSGLTAVTYPVELEAIGPYAFCGVRIAAISLPSKLKTIGEYAFSSCSKATSITISDSVESVGTYAFSYCSAVKSCYIGASVTNLNESAKASGSTSIFSPDFRKFANLTVSDDNQVFSAHDGFVFSKDDTVIYGAFKDVIGEYTVPDSVVIIADDSFSGSKITALKFSEQTQINTIGIRAFGNCNELCRVDIPAGLLHISDNAFYYCSKLTDVILSDSVESVSGSAFRWSGVTNVYVGAGVTNLNAGENYYASEGLGLTPSRFNVDYLCIANFEISESNTTFMLENGFVYSPDKTILYGAPRGLDGIFEVPDSVKIIADEAFNSSQISGLVFSAESRLEEIGNAAFKYCEMLVDVKFPDSLRLVGIEAFFFCQSFREVKFPDAVALVGPNALGCCFDLKKIVFGRGLRNLGSEFIQFDFDADVYFTGDAPEMVVPDNSMLMYDPGLFTDFAKSNWVHCTVFVRPGSVGWDQSNPESKLIPKLWPMDQQNPRPLRYWNPGSSPIGISGHVTSRYPWSGVVDIRYEIAADDPAAKVESYSFVNDAVMAPEETVVHKWGEQGVGVYRFVWDAREDLAKGNPNYQSDTAEVLLLGFHGDEGWAEYVRPEFTVDVRMGTYRLKTEGRVALAYSTMWPGYESDVVKIDAIRPGGARERIFEGVGDAEGVKLFSEMKEQGIWRFQLSTSVDSWDAEFVCRKEIPKTYQEPAAPSFEDAWGAWSDEHLTLPSKPQNVSEMSELARYLWQVRDAATVSGVMSANVSTTQTTVVLSVGEIPVSQSMVFDVLSDKPYDTVHDVPVWHVRMSEDGAGVLKCSIGGKDAPHVTIPRYDPEKWAEFVYGKPPDWLNEEEIAAWYEGRQRSNVEWMATLIPAECFSAYRGRVEQEQKELIDRKQDVEAVGFVAHPYGLHVIRVGTATDCGVDVYGNAGLKGGKWVYKGTLVGGTAGTFVGFVATNSSYFAKIGKCSADTDGDGINDTAESTTYKTDPASAHSSGDALMTDWEKIFRFGLNPLSRDTDGDGYDDVEEILSGTNPLVPEPAAGSTIRYVYDDDDRLIGTFQGDKGAGIVTELSPAGNQTVINVRAEK